MDIFRLLSSAIDHVLGMEEETPVAEWSTMDLARGWVISVIIGAMMGFCMSRYYWKVMGRLFSIKYKNQSHSWWILAVCLMVMLLGIGMTGYYWEAINFAFKRVDFYVVFQFLVAFTVSLVIGVVMGFCVSSYCKVDARKTFLDELKKYSSSGCMVPVPVRARKEEINISSIFTDFDCITETGGDKDILRISAVINEDFMKITNRAVFIGAVGLGKTTLTKHIVSKWMTMIQDSNDPDFILIYLRSREVKLNSSLYEEVSNMISSKQKFIESKTVETIMKSYNVLVLIDDLDGLSEYTYTKYDRSKDSHSVLRIGDLVNNSYDKDISNIRVWVTSRNNRADEFVSPDVKVFLKGFNVNDKKAYIEKVQSGPTNVQVNETDAVHELYKNYLDPKDTFFVTSPLFTSNHLLGMSSPKSRHGHLTLTRFVKNAVHQLVDHSEYQESINLQQMELNLEIIAKNKVKSEKVLFDQECRRLALAIGIVDNDGFSHDLLQEYYLALALTEGDKTFVLRQMSNESQETLSTRRILMFLFGSGSKLIYAAADELMKSNRWDVLKECLQEVESEGLLTKIHDVVLEAPKVKKTEIRIKREAFIRWLEEAIRKVHHYQTEVKP